jgi:type II secretory ATPase GspE/PulE/Tfp pilus assembly ATPase PilB-like protein
VNEVMITGPRLQAAIDARKGWQTLQRLALQGGMRTMHQVAADWVTEGKTTLAEVDAPWAWRSFKTPSKKTWGRRGCS